MQLYRIPNASLLRKPILLPIRYKLHRHNNLLLVKNSLVESLNELATNGNIHIIAKSITAFTMIYCTLNYIHYKNLNDNDIDKK